jgi:hypothetical protein
MSTSNTSKLTSERRKPNAFYLYEAVNVHKPAEIVFNFIVKELHKCYPKLAPGHKKFQLIGADEITEGITIDCQESAGNQEVHHQYKVSQVLPNKLVSYASRPSQAFIKTPGRVIEGKSNTFVYYDLEETSSGETQLGLTIVLQMPGFFDKFLSSVTGTGKLWNDHLKQELHALKAEIEIAK